MIRWKRLVKCLAGRRCANVVVPNLPELQAGTVVNVEFTCVNCGTHYLWRSDTGKRRVIPKLSHPEREGVTLDPGESETFILGAPQNPELN